LGRGYALSTEKATHEGRLEPKWFLLPIALVFYVTAIYLIQPFAAEGLGSYVISINNMILAIVGAMLFAMVAHRFGWLSSRPGQISAAIAVGLVAWTFAETTWLAYESVGESPFPSVADLFYVAGYIAFAVALLLNIRTIRVKFKPQVLGAWIVLSTISFVVIVFLAILPLFQGPLGLDTAVSLVYPLADLVIIILALVIVLKFRSGEIAKPWVLLVLGFILQAVGDTWFEYAQNTGTYLLAYHPSDFLLALGYTIILSSGLFFMLTYRTRGGQRSA
jgi:hypothetical protein